MNQKEQSNHLMSSIETEFAPPDRSSCSSAPPALQLASESLFAFKVEYANIFSDIRAHEDYMQYYENNKEKKTLPVPLEPNPFLWNYAYETEERPYKNSLNVELQAQESFQNLNIRPKAIEIPSENNHSGIWNPTPRQARKGISLNNNGLIREDSKEFLNKFSDLNYSSSPSTQTVLNSAHFIWKDEESNFSSSQPTNSDIYTSNTEVFQKLETPKIPETTDTFQFYNENKSPHLEDENIVISKPTETEDDQTSNSTSKPNVICRYYSAGYCSRGDKCFYSHNVEVQDVKTESKPKSNKGNKSNSKGKSNENFNNNNTNKDSNNGINHNSNNTPTSHEKLSKSNTSPDPTDSITSPRGIQEYTSFDQLIGKVYSVSKDQQGCRFLQKKLEEKDLEAVETIFKEVYDHITELMTDPFGNYLCQKLLEHCNDNQRYSIVQRVAPELVSISKNMHGTRAVQKMIEHLSSPAQISLVKRALSNYVVELIQDLNGNHVIQRCLNRLCSEDNQFIYDAVTSGKNCVEVATHRHGCCVLQRCIDHASNKQKVQLIQEITKNSLALVQDPYGNYVVQYVFDLPFPDLVDSLARAFYGNLRILATQKFSSNVVEKCLAVAGPEARYMMIKEILAEKAHFYHLLQDPFANYVIQTALTVSENQQHFELVEAIRPHLNQLRNTPYGKRIQSKITKESGERSKK